ncbi:MAG: ribonucleoside-diphosphate reductase subunit alpha [Bacteroidia bacterium]|nr:ribonucleoside-diphosphate reductase subunit alpha [Bacteroidia bacterium]
MQSTLSFHWIEESLRQARSSVLILPQSSAWGLLTSFPRELANGEVPHYFEADPYMKLLAQAWLSTRLEEAVDYDQLRQLMQAWLGPVISWLDQLPPMVKPTEADIVALIARSLFEQGQDVVAYAFLLLRAQEHGEKEPLGVLPLVRRRTGQVVPWMENKIYRALEKAFRAVGHSPEPIPRLVQRITERVFRLGTPVVELETIQDLVIEALLLEERWAIARAYALYRAKRAQERLEAVRQAPLQLSLLEVVEPNGSVTFWDGAELRARLAYAVQGLSLPLSETAIETALRKSLYSGISRENLQKTLILNAKSLMEYDSDFAIFAGRILLSYIYEETLGWDILRHGPEALPEFHQRGFRPYLERGVAIERLDSRLLDFDIQRLSQEIDPTYDKDFTYLGIQTLYDRYLIVDKTSKRPRRIETPQFFWMRVAMGLHVLEGDERESRVLALYDRYRRRLFCSSTPTLFNSGTVRPQLSSCYLYKVDDSIESIMLRGIAENAFLSKWAGGLGGSWTAVRGTGAYIKGTNGESQGVIPFLKMHNDQLVAVNQGGKRAGSGCAYLEVWHNDIFDFLELRRNTGDERRRTHDLNTASWIPDLFMKRMETRQHWTLFRSNEVPDLHELYGKAFEERYEYYEKQAEKGEIWGQRIEAIELWKQMLRMLFETGHPWMTFKDPSNIRSPQDHMGVVHSSNLCTEITLNTSAEETAVCNLGSIVLENHLREDGSIDWELLRETIRIAVRALDNVIDINFYPVEAARRSNLRHRPIGLGIMGWHYLLMAKRIAFDSSEAVELADELMEFIAYEAYAASSDLAGERGPYPSFKGSKWDRGLLPPDTLELLEQERGLPIQVDRKKRKDWDALRLKIQQQGMRNSNVLAIAPTATISNIMGSSPSIEPLYSNMYVKSNLSGDFVVLNPYLVRDLKEAGLWTEEIRKQLKYFDGDLSQVEGIPLHLKERYKTAFQIPWRRLIDAAARRQKWIDQAQSLNLFLATPDMKELSHMYRYAWHTGLKTTYYLRTLGASAIEKSTVSKAEIPMSALSPSEKGLEGSNEASLSALLCRWNAEIGGEECEACQ